MFIYYLYSFAYSAFFTIISIIFTLFMIIHIRYELLLGCWKRNCLEYDCDHYYLLQKYVDIAVFLFVDFDKEYI